MNIRRYLVPLIAIAAFLFIFGSASASFGAHWHTGSAVADGIVTGLKDARKTGANVASVLAAPGAKFCTKKGHERDDCRDREHDDKDSSGNFAAMSAPPAANTPGIIFCQNKDYPGVVVQGTQIVNLTVNLFGNSFIPPEAINRNTGEAHYQVTDQATQATLDSLDTHTLCPSSMPEGTGDEDDMPEHPQWRIIDFVPVRFSASLQASDGKHHILTQTVFDCTLPDPHTLTFPPNQDYVCTTRVSR